MYNETRAAQNHDSSEEGPPTKGVKYDEPELQGKDILSKELQDLDNKELSKTTTDTLDTSTDNNETLSNEMLRIKWLEKSSPKQSKLFTTMSSSTDIFTKAESHVDVKQGKTTLSTDQKSSQTVQQPVTKIVLSTNSTAKTSLQATTKSTAATIQSSSTTNNTRKPTTLSTVTREQATTLASIETSTKAADTSSEKTPQTTTFLPTETSKQATSILPLSVIETSSNEATESTPETRMPLKSTSFSLDTLAVSLTANSQATTFSSTSKSNDKVYPNDDVNQTKYAKEHLLNKVVNNINVRTKSNDNLLQIIFYLFKRLKIYVVNRSPFQSSDKPQNEIIALLNKISLQLDNKRPDEKEPSTTTTPALHFNDLKKYFLILKKLVLFYWNPSKPANFELIVYKLPTKKDKQQVFCDHNRDCQYNYICLQKEECIRFPEVDVQKPWTLYLEVINTNAFPVFDFNYYNDLTDEETKTWIEKVLAEDQILNSMDDGSGLFTIPQDKLVYFKNVALLKELIKKVLFNHGITNRNSVIRVLIKKGNDAQNILPIDKSYIITKFVGEAPLYSQQKPYQIDRTDPLDNLIGSLKVPKEGGTMWQNFKIPNLLPISDARLSNLPVISTIDDIDDIEHLYDILQNQLKGRPPGAYKFQIPSEIMFSKQILNPYKISWLMFNQKDDPIPLFIKFLIDFIEMRIKPDTKSFKVNDREYFNLPGIQPKDIEYLENFNECHHQEQCEGDSICVNLSSSRVCVDVDILFKTLIRSNDKQSKSTITKSSPTFPFMYVVIREEQNDPRKVILDELTSITPTKPKRAPCKHHKQCPANHFCSKNLCVSTREFNTSPNSAGSIPCTSNIQCPKNSACLRKECVSIRWITGGFTTYPCNSNRQCPTNYVCLSKKCVSVSNNSPTDGTNTIPCKSNTDCHNNYECFGRQCISIRNLSRLQTIPDSYIYPCGGNKDCPEDYACFDKSCVITKEINGYLGDSYFDPKKDSCRSNKDCSAGFACLQNECVPVEEITQLLTKDPVRNMNSMKCSHHNQCQANHICTAGSVCEHILVHLLQDKDVHPKNGEHLKVVINLINHSNGDHGE